MVLSSCPCTLTRSPDRDRSGALCCLTFAQDQLELNMSRSACKQFLACQQFVLSLFDPLVTTPFFSHFAYNTSTFSNRRMRSQSAASSKTLHSLACMLDSTSNAGACLKKGRHAAMQTCCCPQANQCHESARDLVCSITSVPNELLSSKEAEHK